MSSQALQSETRPQRLQALAAANAVRVARAELKRAVTAGELSAADVIIACPDAAQRWTIGELLLAQHRWGHKRCARFLDRNGISAMKPIGSLTERQRQLVVTQLKLDAVALSDASLRRSEYFSATSLDIRPVL